MGTRAYRCRIARLAALLLLWAAFAMGAALAEESTDGEAPLPGLEVSVSVSPDRLDAPGDVALTFTVENRTGMETREVRLVSADGAQTDPLGDVADGATQTFVHTHAVTQAELDSGRISCLLVFETDAGRCTAPVDAALQTGGAGPSLEFLRRISNACAPKDGWITVIYTVHNVGTLPAMAVSISDPLGEFSALMEQLDAGERQSFAQRVAIEEDAVSEPVLEYAAGESLENTYTTRLNAVTIRAARGALEARLTAGRPMSDPERAEVLLELTNAGNVDCRDLTVLDDAYGGLIAEHVDLPAGERVEITRVYPLRGDAAYRWRVTGRSEAGEAIDLTTETAPLDDEYGQGPNLVLTASTDMPLISRAGYVPVALTLTNDGDETASDVAIFEQSAEDEVRRVAVVPTGAPTVVRLRCEVRQDASLSYYAVYTDARGQQHRANAAPLEVRIGAGGARPEEATSLILPDGAQAQPDGPSSAMLLLIGAIAAVVVLSVALVAASRRAKRMRRERAAVQKQRASGRRLKKK